MTPRTEKDTTTWFLADPNHPEGAKGPKQGPFTVEELHSKLASGTLKHDTKVFQSSDDRGSGIPLQNALGLKPIHLPPRPEGLEATDAVPESQALAATNDAALGLFDALQAAKDKTQTIRKKREAELSGSLNELWTEKQNKKPKKLTPQIWFPILLALAASILTWTATRLIKVTKDTNHAEVREVPPPVVNQPAFSTAKTPPPTINSSATLKGPKIIARPQTAPAQKLRTDSTRAEDDRRKREEEEDRRREQQRQEDEDRARQDSYEGEAYPDDRREWEPDPGAAPQGGEPANPGTPQDTGEAPSNLEINPS